MTTTPRSIADLKSIQVKAAYPDEVSLVATVEGTYNPASGNMSQQGRLSDGDKSIRFTSYLDRDRRLKVDETYAITNARLTSPYGRGGTRELVLSDATSVVHASKTPSSGSVVSSTCPNCQTPFSMNDYREDANRPEIGWEYYECSNCAEAVVPEAL
jgi:hypothetical protein